MSRELIEMMGRQGLRVSHLNSKTAIVRQLGWFDLYVDKKDGSLGTCLIRDGFWESWITAWMTRNILHDDVCVDVGANMGYYTGLMATCAGRGGLVYAFEPQPMYVDSLLSSIELNGWEHVMVYDKALSDKFGVISLNIPGDMRGSASITIKKFDDKWGEQTSYDVETITLDSLELERVDLIKIDAEGAEPEIWRGMQETLKRNPEITVVMEWDSNNWGAEKAQRFMEELESTMNITKIDTNSEEQPVDAFDLVHEGGWEMLVLRRKNA